VCLQLNYEAGRGNSKMAAKAKKKKKAKKVFKKVVC
jgi:hypothetical protein